MTNSLIQDVFGFEDTDEARQRGIAARKSGADLDRFPAVSKRRRLFDSKAPTPAEHEAARKGWESEDEIQRLAQAISSDFSGKSQHAISGDNTMPAPRLEHQLELLNDLQNYLKNVQDQMDAARAEYGRRVDELLEAGMIPNHHEYLRRNVFNQTESVLLKFITHLQERDIMIVGKEINYVEEEIERTNQSSDDY